MGSPLSGPGIGLPQPQNLYPTAVLDSAPYDIGTNKVALAPGDELHIPAGTWYVTPGLYSLIEFRDPILGIWVPVASGPWLAGPLYVKSDGFNYRVANRTGCPVGGIVTGAGSGYVQASTTVAVTGGGGSTWQPIVGGALAVVGATLTSNGAGYGVAPILFIPPPPPAASNVNGIGGIPATGYCVIANGTVSGVTLTNQGAGYPTAPTPVILPNPTDPNINIGITQAVVAFSLTQSGSITGVLCTNPGAALSTPANITLTVSGVGSQGTVAAVMLSTVVTASITGGSTIVGGSSGALITTTGGGYPGGSIAASPELLGLAGRPRPANINWVVSGTGVIAAGTVTIATQAGAAGAIIDGGLFYQTPTPILSAYTSLLATSGTVVGSSTLALVMGSRVDITLMQPAP